MLSSWLQSYHHVDLAKRVGTSIPWAIAARDQGKLKKVKEHLGEFDADVGKNLPVVPIDIKDQASVDKLVGQTRVLLNTAGPFAQLGTPVMQNICHLNVG